MFKMVFEHSLHDIMLILSSICVELLTFNNEINCTDTNCNTYLSQLTDTQQKLNLCGKNG